MKAKGVLTFFCGKMGAGKSTKARLVAVERNAVLISEDDWLALLYPGQIDSLDDYLKFSALIKPLVKSHVQNILETGTDVVMDFPGNTIRHRKWLLDLCKEINCHHELIYLDLTDEQCLTQIAKRRIEQPERALFDTEIIFHRITKYFEAPTDAENLNIAHFCGKL